MDSSRGDLHVLGRSADLEARVPAPRFRWKTRVLGPGVILLAVGGLLAYTAREALTPATAVRVVPVVVKAVQDGGGAAVVQAPGWIEADPFAISVSALTDGVVKEMLALEGQEIKAGQVVARLVDEDAKLALAAAEAELGEKQAEVLLAEAALKAAQRDWDHPIDRKRAVAVGQGLLEESRRELAKLASDIAAEAAKHEEIQEEFTRKNNALARQAASEFEVVQARLRLVSQQAVLESTRGMKPVLEARIARLEAELEAAQEHLELRISETRLLEEGKAGLAKAKAALARAEARREEAKLRVERMQVRSPAEGVVLTRLAEPGSKLLLSADAPQSAVVLRLYDPKKLQIRVDVPLASAGQVSVGQGAQIVVDVLPERTFQGRVTRVVHEADIQKNTLQVKVAIEAPAPQLKPEMLARVRLMSESTGQREQGQQRVFAPRRLLRGEGDGARVWVVDQGRSAAVERAVKVGSGRSEGWVEVVEGLQPGDRLIATETGGLREGSRVQVTGEDAMQ